MVEVTKLLLYERTSFTYVTIDIKLSLVYATKHRVRTIRYCRDGSNSIRILVLVWYGTLSCTCTILLSKNSDSTYVQVPFTRYRITKMKQIRPPSGMSLHVPHYRTVTYRAFNLYVTNFSDL